MKNYRNSDELTRHWFSLVDLATGRTLALAPGEETTAGVGVWWDEVGWAPEVRPLPDDAWVFHLEPVETAAASPATTDTDTDPEA